MKNTFLSAKTGDFLKSIGFILLFMLLLYISSKVQMLFPPIKGSFMYGVMGTVGAMISVWIFLKIDRKSFASIGMTWEAKTPLRFIYGLGIGILIFVIVIVCLLQFSALTISFSTVPPQWSSLSVYIAFIPLALMEEIGFRSYPQTKLTKTFGIWTSQIIVAVAFGIYHILNGWGVYQSLTGPLVWAFVFGLSAIWSGGIAMPTGIHLALNILLFTTGLKGGATWLFKLSYPEGTTQSTIDRTNQLGLTLQAVVLVLTIILTFWYDKRRKKLEIKRFFLSPQGLSQRTLR